MNTIYITGEGYMGDEGLALFAAHAHTAKRALLDDPEVGHLFRRAAIITYPQTSGHSGIPAGAPGHTAFGFYRKQNGRVESSLGHALRWRRDHGLDGDDVILLLLNDAAHEGGLNRYANMAFASARSAHFAQTMLHEFVGHLIGGCGDEYDNRYGEYLGGGPSSPNLDVESDPARVKWSHLIGRDDGMGGDVGVFPGGGGYARGMFRPTLTSKMRVLNRPFGPVNLEAITLAMGRFIPRLTGDLNGDGRVDFDDLNLALAGDFAQANDVLSNFGRSE
jgi:hypothetical protein